MAQKPLPRHILLPVRWKCTDTLADFYIHGVELLIRFELVDAKADDVLLLFYYHLLLAQAGQTADLAWIHLAFGLQKLCFCLLDCTRLQGSHVSFVHTGAIQLIALSVHLRSRTHTAGHLAAAGRKHCRPAAEALGWLWRRASVFDQTPITHFRYSYHSKCHKICVGQSEYICKTTNSVWAVDIIRLIVHVLSSSQPCDFFVRACQTVLFRSHQTLGRSKCVSCACLLSRGCAEQWTILAWITLKLSAPSNYVHLWQLWCVLLFSWWKQNQRVWGSSMDVMEITGCEFLLCVCVCRLCCREVMCAVWCPFS